MDRRAGRAAVLVLALAVAAPAAWAQASGAARARGAAEVRDAGTGQDAAAGHPTDRAGNTISGGVPAMAGITPSRAELPASAFTKLDAQKRGYLTRQDVSQLEGFEAAFRAGDRNGDGRLDASEFNTAWAVYSGAAR